MTTSYICHWCGAEDVPRNLQIINGDTIDAAWGECPHCDGHGRRQGEPGFDPKGSPRINLLMFWRVQNEAHDTGAQA